MFIVLALLAVMLDAGTLATWGAAVFVIGRIACSSRDSELLLAVKIRYACLAATGHTRAA